MRKTALAIIIVHCIGCFEYAPKGQSIHPFMVPFTKELSLGKIEEFYTTFARDYLYQTAKFKGSIRQNLFDLVMFDWNSIDLAHLGDLTPDQIKAQLMTVFANYERDILADKFGGVVAEMKKLTRNLIIRGIQLDRLNELETFVVTEDNLKEAAAEFKTLNKLFPVKANLMAKTVAAEVAPFNAQIIPQYIQFLVFQQQPHVLFNDFLINVVEAIQSNAAPVTNSNRQTSLETVTELIGVTAHLFAQDATSYNYIATFTRKYIRRGCSNEREFTRRFFVSLYDNVLQMFYRTNTLTGLNEAKLLFTEFFLPVDYTAPTTEYLKFVMLKYAEEGLKSEAQETGTFAKLQRVYLLDLLFTSAHHKYELIPEKKVREVLANFLKLVDLISPLDMLAFNHFRQILILNSDLLSRYEHFFGAFYNLGLFWVQYATWKDIAVKPRTFAGHFDAFIDDAYKRDGGFFTKMWNGWLPDETQFELALSENYVAYKLLTMNAFPGDLADKRIAFHGYEDLEDKNIEELLFETPKLTDLVLTLKELYLNNQALNYGVFRKLSVEPAFWKRLREVSPTMFEQRLLLNII